jgi:hypothetical protein
MPIPSEANNSSWPCDSDPKYRMPRLLHGRARRNALIVAFLAARWKLLGQRLRFLMLR